MEAYWIKKQNRLLQRHYDARPNQREFWFSNIVDELNLFQSHIESIKARQKGLLF